MTIGLDRRRLMIILALLVIAPWPARAQTPQPSPAVVPAAVTAGAMPLYQPPSQPLPGGRVSGASRGTVKEDTPRPRIEVLAPADHAGLTASAEPTLYYYSTQPVGRPIQLTIRVPDQPAPIVETGIPQPTAAGIYAVRLGDYGVRLQPGIDYTWSISVVMDRASRSRDIVASGSISRTNAEPSLDSAVRSALPQYRAAIFARAGMWYDAVDAAAEARRADRHAALDALMDQVGLTAAAGDDRRTAGGG